MAEVSNPPPLGTGSTPNGWDQAKLRALAYRGIGFFLLALVLGIAWVQSIGEYLFTNTDVVIFELKFLWLCLGTLQFVTLCTIAVSIVAIVAGYGFVYETDKGTRITGIVSFATVALGAIAASAFTSYCVLECVDAMFLSYSLSNQVAVPATEGAEKPRPAPPLEEVGPGELKKPAGEGKRNENEEKDDALKPTPITSSVLSRRD